MPSCSALFKPSSLSSSFLEDTQSATITGWYPAAFKSMAVWSTQICASIPQIRTFLRSLSIASYTASVSYAENVVLSYATSLPIASQISGILFPNPLAYCVVNTIGISNKLSPFNNAAEFATSSSLPDIAGKIFSW